MCQKENFHCSNCNKKHPRPIRKNCEKMPLVAEEDIMDASSSVSGEISSASSDMEDINVMLLTEFKTLNVKMDSIEKCLVTTKHKLQSPVCKQ